MANDNKSLSHTKWNCKYHIVFAPKYRRKVFFGEKREAIGKILRQLCEWKGVEIHEAEICPDHVHMLVSIPPKVAVSSFMGYLKGKSSLMIYEQFGNLKYKYKGREFWCRGYYVDTVGKNKQKIAEYHNDYDRNIISIDRACKRGLSILHPVILIDFFLRNIAVQKGLLIVSPGFAHLSRLH